MSDKELPEPEGAPIPLIVFGLMGLVALFFIGIIASVLLQKPEPLSLPQEESGLKEQPNLLGADDTFRVRFETTAGPFVVQVNPEWAPRGATQFRELVEAGFYNENRFFRVVPEFVVQWGMHGRPEEHSKWQQPIADEPVNHSNTKGTIAFAKTDMPNSRTTQVFISLDDNTAKLDCSGFAPFGQVVEGMENVEKINPEYGETPNQAQIEASGNAYLMQEFPRLDYIKSARIVEESPAPKPDSKPGKQGQK